MSTAVVTEPSGLRSNTGRIICALSIALAFVTGLAIRVRIVRSVSMILNGDEAVTGIAGDLIRRGHLPVTVPANPYGGTSEAFLYAAVSWMPIDRALLLKCVSIVVWLVAAVLVGLLAWRLAGVPAGIMAGCIAWVCGGAMSILSTDSYMGYPSGFAFVAACHLMAVLYLDDSGPTRRFDRRLVLLGLFAGLAIWSHPMFMSAMGLMTVGVALVAFRRARTAPLLIAFGGFVAMLPYLAWNAANDWPALKPQPSPQVSSYAVRVRIFLTQLSPRALGLRSFAGKWSWGTGGRILYFALAALAGLGLVTLLRSGRTSMRLFGLSAVVVLPIMGLFAPLVYFNDGRYFINVMVAWAVLSGIGLSVLLRRVRLPLAWFAIAVPVMGLLLNLAFLNNTVGRTWGDPQAPVRAVVKEIERRGFDAALGSYWVMGRIAFLSEERIATDSVYPLERFPGAQARSRTRPPERRVGVFPAGDERIDVLPLPPERYERKTFGDLVAFFPR